MTPVQNTQLHSTWPASHTFWRDKRVLVTGGSGFLGSFVVDKLRERGAAAAVGSRQQAAVGAWQRQPSALESMILSGIPDGTVGWGFGSAKRRQTPGNYPSLSPAQRVRGRDGEGTALEFLLIG